MWALRKLKLFSKTEIEDHKTIVTSHSLLQLAEAHSTRSECTVEIKKKEAYKSH